MPAPKVSSNLLLKNLNVLEWWSGMKTALIALLGHWTKTEKISGYSNFIGRGRHPPPPPPPPLQGPLIGERIVEIVSEDIGWLPINI